MPEDPCPIGPVVDLVFGRWTTHVLWVLTNDGRMRFTELQQQLPMVSPKVLTQRLRKLERDGLVERTYFPEMPPRVEYETTELGRTLSPVFQTLAAWSDRHMDQIASARQRYDNEAVV